MARRNNKIAFANVEAANAIEMIDNVDSIEAIEQTDTVDTVEEVHTVPAFDKDEYIKEQGNKSNAIRKLLSEGKTRSEVAKMLDVIYQHVRNVEITPIKKPKIVK